MSLELSGSLLVASDDGFAVTRAVFIDMCQGLVQRTDCLNGQFVVHKLRTEALCGGML